MDLRGYPKKLETDRINPDERRKQKEGTAGIKQEGGGDLKINKTAFQKEADLVTIFAPHSRIR